MNCVRRLRDCCHVSKLLYVDEQQSVSNVLDNQKTMRLGHGNQGRNYGVNEREQNVREQNFRVSCTQEEMGMRIIVILLLLIDWQGIGSSSVRNELCPRRKKSLCSLLVSSLYLLLLLCYSPLCIVGRSLLPTSLTLSPISIYQSAPLRPSLPQKSDSFRRIQ